MNREIKFRVWVGTYIKPNFGEILPDDYEPKYEYSMIYPNRFGSMFGQFGWSDRGYLDVGSIGDDPYEDSDRCILMQFTGLKDKNGKEIYEGDIVSVVSSSNDGVKVEWGYAGWYPFEYDGGVELSNDLVYIIGNIFENPKLLK